MAQEDQGYVNVSESGSEVANAAQTVTNDISDSEMYGEGETVNVHFVFSCVVLTKPFWAKNIRLTILELQ